MMTSCGAAIVRFNKRLNTDFAELGDSAGARDLIEQMVTEGHAPTLITVNTLIKTHRMAGDPQGAEAVLMDAQNLSVLGLKRKPLPALPEVAAAVETDDEGDSEDKGEGHAEGLADAETKAGAEAETETATQKIMKEYHARIEAARVKASAAHDEVESRRASLAHYW